MATENKGKRLQELKVSDYEIVDGEPDIRGWDVQDSTRTKIGKVNELIFDTQLRKVRYMIVDLNNKDLGLIKRTVLVPIGLGELHTKDDDVLLTGVTAGQLNSLPEYDENITAENETAINGVFAGVATAGVAGTALNNDDADLYDHDNYNENNLFKNRKDATAGNNTVSVIEENLKVGKQTVQTGGVYIKSRIVEHPAEETVNLKEEHVIVERTPVNRVVSNTDLNTFQEGTVELTEHAEVPVVSKEARVVEEISLGKEVNEREETIRDTVRHTEVDIENLDKNNTSTGTDY